MQILLLALQLSPLPGALLFWGPPMAPALPLRPQNPPRLQAGSCFPSVLLGLAELPVSLIRPEALGRGGSHSVYCGVLLAENGSLVVDRTS